MRILVIAIVAACGLWSGYWAVGSRGASGDVAEWFAERSAGGWVADYSDAHTRGFPYRFDTTITGVVLSDPVSGLGWTAPFLQILRLSYRPNHAILIFPEAQVIETPRHRVSVTGDKMRASAVFGPDAPLPRATLQAEGLSLSADQGWSVMTGRLLVSIRDSPAAESRYDLDVRAQGIGLAPGAPRLDLLALNGSLSFDAPFDRLAFAGPRPALTAIELRSVTFQAGNSALVASGSLSVDSAGLLDGTLDLHARNWRDVLRAAQGAGWISAELAGRIVLELENLGTRSAKPDEVNAMLRFRRGTVSLGPAALGRVPPLGLFQRQ